MKRPSPRELYRKLKLARAAASEKRIAFVEPDVILSDLLDLGFLVEELPERLPEILTEIRPGDYQGQRPPAKSYERSILNCELFAFRWSSIFFGCQMYLKFAIKGDYLWIVSLHKHREPEGGEANELPE